MCVGTPFNVVADGHIVMTNTLQMQNTHATRLALTLAHTHNHVPTHNVTNTQCTKTQCANAQCATPLPHAQYQDGFEPPQTYQQNKAVWISNAAFYVSLSSRCCQGKADKHMPLNVRTIVKLLYACTPHHTTTHPLSHHIHSPTHAHMHSHMHSHMLNNISYNKRPLLIKFNGFQEM